MLLVGEHAQLQHVRVVQRQRVEPPALGGRVVGRHDLDELGPGVVLGQRRLQVARGRLAGQRVEMQRHAHQHALAEIADRRHEDRPPREPEYCCISGRCLCSRPRPYSSKSGASPAS